MPLERAHETETPPHRARSRPARPSDVGGLHLKHPVLRLLALESATTSAVDIWLRQAISEELPPQKRVDSALDFANAVSSSAANAAKVVDPDGVLLELLDILEPLSVDPRLVEERIRLAAPAPANRRQPSPCFAGNWIRRFATSPELACTLAEQEPAWRADQCASALRLLRQGLLDTDAFSALEAQDAFKGWVQPFWAIVLDALGDAIRMQFPADYQALYGPYAQRLVWERLRGSAPAFSPIDPVRDGLAHVVVVGEIPPSHDAVDKAQIAAHQRLRAPLPLTPLPSAERIHEIADRLSAEFPWALEPIGAIVREALARRLLGAQAMGGGKGLLLVGPPGCGKSRLARRLAEEFELAFMPLPMAGQGDHKILAGTSRGWAGGQPSPIITAMMSLGCANPAVLVDEIDKALTHSGEPGQGPSPTSLLLGLTEPENSRHWRDNFLQAPCDVSKIFWIATANRTSHLDSALLDRFRRIELSAPLVSQFAAALPYIAADLEREMGVPAGRVPELPASLVSSNVRSLRDLRLIASTYVQDWAIENLDGPRH